MQVFLLILLGLGAGFLSGMFGVGGGILIVPGLIAIMGFTPRLASGTSLITIVPLALVGVLSYRHDVSWVAGGLLALGGLAGAQLGTWLLSRISSKYLQRFFALFMIASTVMLFVSVPSRDATLEINWVTAAALVAVGFLVGTLSGLLGVGGGIIVVPAMMLLFGASDLVAKGTSLLMMIPSALGGSIPNLLRKNLDLRVAAIVGLSACTTTLLGAQVAHLVSPIVANIFFAVFLVIVAVRMLVKSR